MAYVDSTTAAGQSSTPAVAVPTGVQADDIVIITLAYDIGGNIDTADLPTGFTTLGEIDCTADRQVQITAWKRLTGADSGSYTMTDTGLGSQIWIMQAIAFRGRHLTDPPTASTAVQNTGQSTPVSVNAATVTAVSGDDLLWISGPDVLASGIGNGHTPPTGFTEAEDAESTWANLSMAYDENVGAGATGTVTGTFALTSDTAGWGAYLVRIPAAAGGATSILRQMMAHH